MKNLRNTKINDRKNRQNLPRRNKYILNIFKFYILKYIIKFLQSYDNNKKKIQLSISRNTCKKFAEHRLRTRALESLVDLVLLIFMQNSSVF